MNSQNQQVALIFIDNEVVNGVRKALIFDYRFLWGYNLAQSVHDTFLAKVSEYSVYCFETEKLSNEVEQMQKFGVTNIGSSVTGMAYPLQMPVTSFSQFQRFLRQKKPR